MTVTARHGSKMDLSADNSNLVEQWSGRNNRSLLSEVGLVTAFSQRNSVGQLSWNSMTSNSRAAGNLESFYLMQI